LTEPLPSLAQVALSGRCPRCGRGKLFKGLLDIRDRCDACGLDLREHDAGDGAAAGVTLVLGAIIVALAFWVEFHFSPPMWVHLVLWPVLILAGSILLTRIAKAALVAMQFRHRASEMGL
jgi:uncharacterized protein (DUF983 family)